MIITDVRWGDIQDIQRVEQTAYSPWSKKLICDELRAENSIQLAARKEGKTIGWCCARIQPPEAELLKIIVIPEERRCGAASLLLNTICNLCRQYGCTTLILEVRSNEIPALSFYTHREFQNIGVRKNYYSFPRDDAVIMKKELLPTIP